MNNLLKNKVYLYLLAFYNGKEIKSYSHVGREIGVTRQTVSSTIAKLKEERIISSNDDKVLEIKNIYNLNIEKLQQSLKDGNISLQDLIEISDETDIKALCKDLGISRASWYNDTLREKYCVVYGIIEDGQLKYVGSTDNFATRRRRHMEMRTWLTEDNFIIMRKCSPQDKLDIERYLIKVLQPEWNTVSK